MTLSKQRKGKKMKQKEKKIQKARGRVHLRINLAFILCKKDMKKHYLDNLLCILHQLNNKLNF